MKSICWLGGALLALWQCPASAAIVSLDFQFPGYVFDGGGSDLTFRISYDSHASNQSGDPAIGKYAATLVFISDGQATAPLATLVDITNSPVGSGTDSFAMELVDLSKLSPLPVVDGHQVDTAEFQVLDDSGGMLNGIGLPLSPDFASSANRAFVGLHRTDAEGPVNQGYDQGFFFVVASSPVPEPQTWFAIVLGIAGLVRVRRSRHSK